MAHEYKPLSEEQKNIFMLRTFVKYLSLSKIATYEKMEELTSIKTDALKRFANQHTYSADTSAQYFEPILEGLRPLVREYGLEFPQIEMIRVAINSLYNDEVNPKSPLYFGNFPEKKYLSIDKYSIENLYKELSGLWFILRISHEKFDKDENPLFSISLLNIYPKIDVKTEYPSFKINQKGLSFEENEFIIIHGNVAPHSRTIFKGFERDNRHSFSMSWVTLGNDDNKRPKEATGLMHGVNSMKKQFCSYVRAFYIGESANKKFEELENIEKNLLAKIGVHDSKKCIEILRESSIVVNSDLFEKLSDKSENSLIFLLDR